MIKTFRIKLTIYFVVLSFIVCMLIAGCNVIFFSSVLTKSLDDRLYMLASEVGHAIDLDAGKAFQTPRLRDWHRRVTTDPARGLASAQLIDRNGQIVEAFGPDGLHHFYKSMGEVAEEGRHYRVIFTPLKVNQDTVGYVQVNTSTADRDHSINWLITTLCLGWPLVLLGLGVTSYYVSGIAAEPLAKNMVVMRRFIADAGHELNTPLTIVRAKTEALDRRLNRIGITEHEIEANLRSLSRMEKIVSDLMYLTELDTEPMNEHFEKVDVGLLLRQISEDFADRFSETNVGLIVSLEFQGDITGEPELLYRALANLTENAFRYTSEGCVEITAVAEHGEVKLTVSDTGIGIPAEGLNRLFERFYRVDKSRSRQSGGVGLGLSIVRAVVEGHHGSISVVSEPGKGTQIVLTFPSA